MSLLPGKEHLPWSLPDSTLSGCTSSLNAPVETLPSPEELKHTIKTKSGFTFNSVLHSGNFMIHT